MATTRIVVFCLVGAVAGTTHAAEPTFHTTLEVNTAYDDNILAVPDEPPDVTPPVGPPSSDMVIRIAPGVAVRYETATMLWQARYTHAFVFYATHPAADTSADILHGDAELAPTPDDVIRLNFDMGRYSTNISTLGAPAELQLQAQRGSDSTLISIAGSDEWSHILSESWSWMQSASAGIGIPVGGGGSLFATGLRTGPQLAFVDHAFGLQSEVTYAEPLGGPTGPSGYQAERQVIVGGRGSWHWAFAPPDWSLSANAGAVAALEAGETEVEPVGGGAIRFQREGWGVTASFDRGYVPNIITGQTFFVNRWVLRGEIPISTEYDIRASTGSGFSISRAVDVPRDVRADEVKTVVADAAVGWYPDIYPHIEARYQHTHQWDAPPDQLVLPNYDRNVVSLSVSYMWPPVELTLPSGHHRMPEDAVDPLAPIQ